MGKRKFLALIGVTVASLAAFAGSVSASEHSTGNIVDLPVSFSVQNTNKTPVPCLSDGKNYTIKGHITAPASALRNPKSATLYLHAVTQGEFYWRFNAVRGYNFARQQAQRGHVSVTIDRLGYGASGKPQGLASCFGSQATTANQVITALRNGKYQVRGGKAVKFGKVFVAGHSAGGLTATILAYAFRDNVDGLINFGWADQTTSTFTVDQLANTTARCLAGGDPGAPAYYAKFGPDGDRILFHSAEPAVRAAVPPLTNPDPCGDVLSFGPAIGADVVGVPLTKAPVLLVAGGEDALFPAPALQLQKLRYIGNPDVTLKELPNTAHGFNYEASHLKSVSIVDSWLRAHGG